MLRRLLAVFIALHGLAHLAGTSDSFARASANRSVDYVAGLWTVSDPTVMRFLGVVWALLAAALIAVAMATWKDVGAWPRLLAWAALASLAAVVVGLWGSVVGVVIDLVLLSVAIRAMTARRELRPA